MSNQSNHLNDIEEYLNNQKPKVRKNAEIVKANPDYPYMLHGSVNGNIKEIYSTSSRKTRAKGR